MYYAEFRVERLGINEVEGIFYDWYEDSRYDLQSSLEDFGFGKRDGTTGRPFAIECFVEFRDNDVRNGITFEILLTQYVLAGGQVDVIKEY